MTSVIQDIFNVILFCMWGFVMFTVLHSRWRLRVAVPVYLLFVALTKGMSSLMSYLSIVKPFLGVIIMLIAALVLFEDRPVRRIMVPAGCFMTMSIAEFFFAVLLFDTEVPADGMAVFSAWQQIGVFAAYLLLSAIMLFFLTLLFKKTDGADVKEGIILTLILLAQYTLLMGTLRFTANDVPNGRIILMIICLAACVGMDIAVVLTLRAAERRAEAMAEKLSLETLVAAQETHYQELTEQYESTRKMRHDIANHLYTMQILIENGRADEAARYADEIGGSADFGSSLVGCMNSVLDAFLSRRLRELEEQGVRVTAEIGIPAGLQLANAELISAFGNLLDNAEDACADTEEAFVELRSVYRAPYLRIEMKNSCAKKDAAQNKKRRIPELERGVGTKILRSMAEKHGGEFRLSETDGICSSELILKETEYAQNSDLR